MGDSRDVLREFQDRLGQIVEEWGSAATANHQHLLQERRLERAPWREERGDSHYEQKEYPCTDERGGRPANALVDRGGEEAEADEK